MTTDNGVLSSTVPEGLELAGWVLCGMVELPPEAPNWRTFIPACYPNEAERARKHLGMHVRPVYVGAVLPNIYKPELL